jgi:O-antigen ligase
MIRIIKTIRIAISKSGYLAFISAFFAILLLALHNQYMPPFIIAWLLFWLIDFTYRGWKISEDEKKVRFLLFLFLGLNMVFLIGLFYSENIQVGSVLFFRRLSLLVFPILLFSPGYEIKKRIDLILKVFVAGITVFLIICFCYALYRSIIFRDGIWSFDPYFPDQPWLNYFYGQLLSIDQHPSYISMYSLFGMFISLEFFSHKSLKGKVRLLWLTAAVFLFISLYFLSSRASYLAVLVILPVFIWIKFKSRKFNLLGIFSMIVLLGLVSLFYLKNQRVSIYFDKSTDPTILKDGRLEIWKSALKVFEKNPLFGAGIGDYYDAMDKEFKQSGFTTGYYKDFNAHNQYLEILCIAGVSGFLFFLIIFGLMIAFAIKDRNILYGAFIMMMLIFFSFESMLSRFAGNSFFALFSFLLIHYKGSDSGEKEH